MDGAFSFWISKTRKKVRNGEKICRIVKNVIDIPLEIGYNKFIG